ncbi:MAG: gliding motility-associated ABC transporter ATP-binding subunit GldA [Bacteroidia bacterium]|nr:gliding motility-associated ABC transporter ATP-binding subunit GldA [Bacteroidia bacterium]
MSIQVQGVTKLYGSQKALNNVSFDVDTGQIVGFLGPNGAGKSTMMKIITCYLPPSSGSVKVLGKDIDEDSVNIRKNIGYLPEHNPLYLDMYIKEFLSFSAGLFLSGGDVKKRVAELIELTGLTPESGKKIGALSKGYRQRVGLAQALIHDPKILILDEPTSGLDPNQLADIRELIKSLGKEKTVMLSTHIMQEVEAICDRVIIINQGEIAANEPIKSLQRKMEKEIVYNLEFDKEADMAKMKQIEHVLKVENSGENQYKVFSDAKADISEELFKFAVSESLIVKTLQQEKSRLEDIFQKLTSAK